MKKLAENKVVTIDAAGRVPGRLATEVAVILRGKDQPDFQRHIAGTTKVQVQNARQLKISSAKAGQKLYLNYSGYPGGQKLTTQTELIAKFGPGEVLRRAVYRMLPANKLRPLLMKNLTITN